MLNVSNNQTLLDVALLTTGDASTLIQLAYANGLSITDDLSAAPLYAVAVKNASVVNKLQQAGARPATAITAVPVTGNNQGNKVQVVIPVVAVRKVQQNQTLLDCAILYTGSAEALVALAALNGLSITDQLFSGQVLECTTVVNADVKTELSNQDARPATAIKPGSEAELLEGIGYWAIGLDFIVS